MLYYFGTAASGFLEDSVRSYALNWWVWVFMFLETTLSQLITLGDFVWDMAWES